MPASDEKLDTDGDLHQREHMSMYMESATRSVFQVAKPHLHTDDFEYLAAFMHCPG